MKILNEDGGFNNFCLKFCLFSPFVYFEVRLGMYSLRLFYLPGFGCLSNDFLSKALTEPFPLKSVLFDITLSAAAF